MSFIEWASTSVGTFIGWMVIILFGAVVYGYYKQKGDKT